MDEEAIRISWDRIHKHLNERERRLWCANEALRLGHGGVKAVCEATSVDPGVVIRGKKDLVQAPLADGQVRRKGGGRKRAADKNPALLQSLRDLVSEATRGDPESPLLWCSKSLRNLSKVLQDAGYAASHMLVRKLLHQEGYTLQSNRKTKEGSNHPDRDGQFCFINEKVKVFQADGDPVISVDTKKKENIGNFKNAGREYHEKGQAPQVNVYDFLDKEKGKVAPYGIYDLARNKGWVSVGTSSDTAEFAVNSIRSWWHEMGRKAYPHARKLYINADGGGSNGSRNRLWKVELQKLAHEIGIDIHVSHFPPGTSKWNKIEHKMFCFISQNWRGKPLIDHATVVSLIGNTTTKTGLTIRAKLDVNTYEKGINIPDKELQKIALKPDNFCGQWNYVIQKHR